VVTGMLARESEGRHAVGAENEIPDIAGYSGGEAGFFQIWSTRAKKILARGRSFYIGSIGEQQQHIISRRDPAARPVLAGAAEAAAPAPAAPRDQPGTGLRDRLAHARELNEGHPLPARTGPLPSGSRVLPMVPGVPGEVVAAVLPMLASGRTSASAVGLALGISKTAAFRHLSAMRAHGVAEQAGTGRGAGWRLAAGQEPEQKPEPGPEQHTYTTLAELAEAAHDGKLPGITEEQREILEQVWQIAHRPHLTLVKRDGQ
jgi:hypothetical protein